MSDQYKTNTYKKELCKICLCIGVKSIFTNTNNTFSNILENWRVRKFVLEKLSYIFVYGKIHRIHFTKSKQIANFAKPKTSNFPVNFPIQTIKFNPIKILFETSIWLEAIKSIFFDKNKFWKINIKQSWNLIKFENVCIKLN